MDYSYIKSEKDNCLGIFVCIPGLAHTKEHFLKTPDGREGWAFDLSKAGFDVYVVNWYNLNSPTTEFDSNFIIESISNFINTKIQQEVFLLTHSASGSFGWKLAEINKKIKKIVAIAPAPPGNIQEIPESIISEDGNTISVMHLNTVPYNFSLNKNWVADSNWIKQKAIGSKTNFFPEDWISNYQASLVSVPGKIMYERMNIKGSQIKINPLKIKENNPSIFIFTGDEDISHSYEIDKKINDYLLINNINSKFFWLADYGFKSNGHMLMLQSNSKDIIDFIISKIK